MKDQHQHCPCNGAWLCHICHEWCHKNPAAARDEGFMVSRHHAEPGSVPVVAYFGTLLLGCDGGFDYYIEGVHG